MHERVSGSRYIHPALVECTSTLTGALRRLGRQRATVFLAVALYNAPPEPIGKLQISPISVRRIFEMAASMLRHPIVARDFQHLADEIGAFGSGTLIDEEMRALIREWRLAETFEPRCAACDHPLSAPVVSSLQSRPGRPRRYCSNACRQKAYRARRREGTADR
ncbi:hypothetical protein [Streptomyces sp. NPDC016675]|uniref:hypothetical protein n=1 Tax=Streptomyces sp. NPDC016675 TaxID=3364970 RepID=UPI003702360A